MIRILSERFGTCAENTHRSVALKSGLHAGARLLLLVAHPRTQRYEGGRETGCCCYYTYCCRAALLHMGAFATGFVYSGARGTYLRHEFVMVFTALTYRRPTPSQWSPHRFVAVHAQTSRVCFIVQQRGTVTGEPRLTRALCTGKSSISREKALGGSNHMGNRGARRKGS